MKKLLIFIVLFLSVNIAKSQDTNTVNNSVLYKVTNAEMKKWGTQRVGVYASYMSGYGLAYQYQFENGFSVKGQLFAFSKSGDDSNGDELRSMTGFDVQYNLLKNRKVRVYAMAGMGYYYEESEISYIKNGFNIDRTTLAGFGIGAEYRFWEVMTIAGEIGYYGGFERDQEYRNGIRRTFDSKVLSIGCGGGLYFAF